jgi:hypothetical protein
MNVVKIYKIFRAILAISKTVIPVLEELFQKDLNADGIIGKKPKEDVLKN